MKIKIEYQNQFKKKLFSFRSKGFSEKVQEFKRKLIFETLRILGNKTHIPPSLDYDIFFNFLPTWPPSTHFAFCSYCPHTGARKSCHIVLKMQFVIHLFTIFASSHTHLFFLKSDLKNIMIENMLRERQRKYFR